MAFQMSQAPRASLTSFVEAQLRDALMSGRLKPGERLNTRELARQLATSLTPVREALLKLVAAGALDAAPAQAFQVPIVSRARFLEIATIRKSLEGLAAELACARIARSGIDGLVALNEGFREAKAAGRVAEALERNRAFRFALFEEAAMPTLTALIEQLWLQIGPSFNYLYPQPGFGPGDRHNYDDLIDALRARDEAGCRRAIEHAIDDGARILLEHYAFEDAPRGIALAAIP